MAARSYIKTARIIDALSLNGTSGGGRVSFTKELPTGEGWYKMVLLFRFALTVGTAATTRVESLLRYIANVQLRTSAGEMIVDLPGAALWDIAKIKSGTNPAVYTDAAPATMISPPTMPATTAVYNVEIPIYFADIKAKRPEDTVLDTSRYSSVTLDVTLGGFADLFSSPGTMSIINTLDVEVERTEGALPGPDPTAPTLEGRKYGAKPIAHIQYAFRQPFDEASTNYTDLEHSPDLWLRRLYFHTVTGGTNVPWGGPAAVKSDVVLDKVSVEDQNGYLMQLRRYLQIRNANKRDLSLEVGFVGVGYVDFMSDGSANSAIFTGNRSVLQFKTTPVTGVGANSFVTVATESHRTLK